MEVLAPVGALGRFLIYLAIHFVSIISSVVPAGAQSSVGESLQIAEIEVGIEIGSVVFSGNFGCGISSICTFDISDLHVAVFPFESFIGVTLSTGGGATAVADRSGKKDLAFRYNEQGEVKKLYLIKEGYSPKEVGSIMLRGSYK